MSAGPAGKSIEGLTPELPAKEAARWTLHVRLRAVEGMLGEATGGGDMDVRTVHRLRVSTRRAAAALRTYAEWTPKKQRKRVRAALRRIRRAAAEARLCDVQTVAFEHLMREADSSLAGPIGVVLGRIVEQRREAGRRVRALRKDSRCGRSALKRLRKRLVKSTGDGDRDMTLNELAIEQVPALARHMDEVGRADLGIIDNVHELRIAGKRLRYAIELFECCFTPEAHDALLERLTRFQDHLGAINDLCDMKARVEVFAGDPLLDANLRAPMDRLAQHVSARLDEAHAQFVDWWSRGGVGSIFTGLTIPGMPAGQIAPQRASGNGDLGPTMDRLIEDAVRHLT